MALPALNFDHAIYGTGDLEATRKAAQKLGFVVTPRGRHKGWGTGNYCVMFEQDYLEFLGMVDPAGESNGLDKFLASGGDGLLAITFGITDSALVAEQLRGRGLNPHGPHALSRLLELPEGDIEPRFALTRLPPEEMPAINGFLVEHLTPELLRRPTWVRHPNAAVGIQSVTVAVENPEETARAYEKLVGISAVTPTDDTWAVHVGKQVILFVTADDAAGLYSDDGTARGLPTICGITLKSSDLDQTYAALKANKIPAERLPGGVIRVDREDAVGAVMDFVRA
ncbi:VOC family protein [Lacibacterium aquatile]|uniref:VOC family protein n=1 Tax=Lacibacterium aquatile TaxID=1168082 RepID=A0ABW5DY06_9PROT